MVNNNNVSKSLLGVTTTLRWLEIPKAFQAVFPIVFTRKTLNQTLAIALQKEEINLSLVKVKY